MTLARPSSLIAAPGSSPLVAVSAATAAGALFAARATQRRPARDLMAIGAFALLGVAAHGPLADIVKRAGTRRRAARIRLSFLVRQPVADVFAFCSNFENFPRLVGALRSVRDTGDGRSHWCVSTPSGGTLAWDAITTKFVTNGVIGWRSVKGAPVEASGLLRFCPEGSDTAVRAEIDYRVLESGLADALAALVAPPRVHQLRREILNMKSLLLAPGVKTLPTDAV